MAAAATRGWIRTRRARSWVRCIQSSTLWLVTQPCQRQLRNIKMMQRDVGKRVGRGGRGERRALPLSPVAVAATS